MFEINLRRKKKEQDEGKGEAEDLGPRLEQPNEDSDFVKLISDCECDDWKIEDQQSEVHNDGAKRRRT